ncbi:DUF1697 domain-containing protein [Ramlibacter albus]|uniref:DUF1697 domain-containing protein n=1 Tax=Ramlibacter albus TaxID=2079448 RepID=A0A923S1P2_9BURK|nr:DUF1697 domain-containing protein [Ramlibacter albus]MBC5763898.1 DUF1697 domain-containing protein [Ramlibacter albus]
MPRYVAFLRGVSPMNAKMPQLKAAFESAGFTHVKTVLSSGNVVFDSRKSTDTALEKKAEAAMTKELGKSFYTIVRSVEHLESLIAADPYAKHKFPKDAKRVVSFVREAPATKPKLPIEFEEARILEMKDRDIFTAYVPQQNNPAFMNLIEKTFGKEVTTRTWDTVQKCAKA